MKKYTELINVKDQREETKICVVHSLPSPVALVFPCNDGAPAIANFPIQLLVHSLVWKLSNKDFLKQRCIFKITFKIIKFY